MDPDFKQNMGMEGGVLNPSMSLPGSPAASISPPLSLFLLHVLPSPNLFAMSGHTLLAFISLPPFFSLSFLSLILPCPLYYGSTNKVRNSIRAYQTMPLADRYKS